MPSQVLAAFEPTAAEPWPNAEVSLAASTAVKIVALFGVAFVRLASRASGRAGHRRQSVDQEREHDRVRALSPAWPAGWDRPPRADRARLGVNDFRNGQRSGATQWVFIHVRPGGEPTLTALLAALSLLRIYIFVCPELLKGF
jgi:hypothetical protein